jgi:hypothetical protein
MGMFFHYLQVIRPTAPFKGAYRFRLWAPSHHQGTYVRSVSCRRRILSHLGCFGPRVAPFQAARPTTRVEDVIADVRAFAYSFDGPTL